jgi:SAM-dependent methyltransferase
MKTFLKFNDLSKNDDRFQLSWSDRYPILTEATKNTAFDTHYVFHTAWAARMVAKIKPQKHIDISSSLYFSTIVSAFIPVEFYDYRPAKLNLSNLYSKPGDLMALPFGDNTVESISCMHTIEHIGLGRYGDPLDPQGDLKAIHELKRVVKTKGHLLFVTPVGQPKIMFNAHRIYSYDQIISYFQGFILEEFSLIPDTANEDGLITNANKDLADKQKYGCGCFHFIKKIT